MMDRMRSRGPDAEGLMSPDGVVLGHRRLAILDLAARANQPMTSDDGRFLIVFNGEIYNFRDLRRALEADGVRFHTSSDTEVLLVLYAREGSGMLRRLRGMFAFAIWDTHIRELFLARDPYGIKPLYYARIGGGLLFASQVKALIASGLVPSSVETAGLAGFYLWGNVPEPWTMYRGVLALPPGHWLRAREGSIGTPTCWHDVRTHWQEGEQTATAEALASHVREAVIDSVRAHLVSDVPVSMFLSGGVDSAVMAALAKELGVAVEGVTVRFDEFAGERQDEAPTAAVTAAHFGLPHVERRISHAEFVRDSSRILEAMDQPSIDGVNTWFASKAVAERGYKVVLSGLGGDELFCGYPSFTRIPRTASVRRAATASHITRAFLDTSWRLVGKHFLHPKAAGIPALAGSIEGAYFLSRGLFLPRELPALMGPEMARDGLARLGGSPSGIERTKASNAAAAIGLLESTIYMRNQLLRDSDWASMDHSLELRTPLVDVRLLAALAPFAASFARAGAGKKLLSAAPRNGLPDVVTRRPKTGFTVPMAKWIADSFAGSARPKPARAMSRRWWARDWAMLVSPELPGLGAPRP